MFRKGALCAAAFGFGTVSLWVVMLLLHIRYNVQEITYLQCVVTALVICIVYWGFTPKQKSLPFTRKRMPTGEEIIRSIRKTKKRVARIYAKLPDELKSQLKIRNGTLYKNGFEVCKRRFDMETILELWLKEGF